MLCSSRSRQMSNDWKQLSIARAKLTATCQESRQSGVRTVMHWQLKLNHSDFATGSVIQQSKAAALREPIHRNNRLRRESLCWVTEMRCVACRELSLKFSAGTEPTSFFASC